VLAKHGDNAVEDGYGDDEDADERFVCVLHIGRFLRVENSLQQVNLCFNAAGKAISMPLQRKIYAPYFSLHTGGGKAAGAPVEEGETLYCTGINGDPTRAFG
jgi:hypothetical protein